MFSTKLPREKRSTSLALCVVDEEGSCELASSVLAFSFLLCDFNCIFSSDSTRTFLLPSSNWCGLLLARCCSASREDVGVCVVEEVDCTVTMASEGHA